MNVCTLFSPVRLTRPKLLPGLWLLLILCACSNTAVLEPQSTSPAFVWPL